MADIASSAAARELADRVRKRFLQALLSGLPTLRDALEAQLLAQAGQVGTAREMQQHRDAWLDWQQHRQAWFDGVSQAWQRALGAGTSKLPEAAAASSGPKPAQPLDILSLELVADDEVENKIIAARMAQSLGERVGQEFSELRSRLQELERGADLPSSDVLRVETLLRLLVEQWVNCGLKREILLGLSEVLRGQLAEQLSQAYQGANSWLLEHGVVPNEDLRSRVRRAPSSPSARPADGETSASMSATLGTSQGGLHSTGGFSGSTHSGPYSTGSQTSVSRRAGAADETHYLTANTPLMRARARAHGLIGQLHRLLVRSVGGALEESPPVSASAGAPVAAMPANGPLGLAGLPAAPASEALAQALALAPLQAQPRGGPGPCALPVDVGPGGVAHAVGVVRETSAELKKKTSNPAEKATIEIVALMFQSILSEERLPSGIRVWFARLQVPVLRVALAEPEFFENLSHPARLLIDRMGSCVLGFDASTVADAALEAEIRRVVQVIEQYPETGRRVFQLVYDEFQKFLDRFLTEKTQTTKLVSVAQQVEQKETLAIQYTIELRNMLKGMPVRDEIRDFLFKVWAEVLALSAVRLGPQHAETVSLKKAASDLVWAASAKPNRADRARVIHDLPMLLQRLRQGLSALGVTGAPQEAHIKVLSETLADAFLSKTEAIPQSTIDAMAKRLAHLEDYVTEEGLDDLPLDAESLEVMLGVDSASLHVVAGGGAKPTEDMLAWALELQPGHWFNLDHNGRPKQVQYAWRSQRRQLHLFASMDGTSYLIQLRRLAAYLQAGLLVPQEEETLTLRATRQALAKLDANPERLLN